MLGQKVCLNRNIFLHVLSSELRFGELDVLELIFPKKKSEGDLFSTQKSDL